MARMLCAGALAALLAGCANPFAEFRPSEAEVVRAGWFEPAERPALAARYCYRTLARVDCHESLLPAEANRRVGAFHPLAAP